MNWGHRLTLVFIIFAAGMFYLMYRCMNVNTDLVTKEYYKDELRYQDIIDGTKTANALSTRIRLDQKGEMIRIKLPGEMKNEKVSGNIWFYCTADARKDKHIPIETNSEAVQLVNKKIFSPGNYTVKFSWTSNKKYYYEEQPLTIL
jgi:hypothetical protein